MLCLRNPSEEPSVDCNGKDLSYDNKKLMKYSMVTLWYCQENLCIKSYLSRKRFLKNLKILKIEPKTKKKTYLRLKIWFFIYVDTYICI